MLSPSSSSVKVSDLVKTPSLGAGRAGQESQGCSLSGSAPRRHRGEPAGEGTDSRAGSRGAVAQMRGEQPHHQIAREPPRPVLPAGTSLPCTLAAWASGCASGQGLWTPTCTPFSGVGLEALFPKQPPYCFPSRGLPQG